MLRRSWTVCAMTALLLGGSAAAQSPGTLLVGGFGTWTHFDSKWGLSTAFGDSWGYGGRVGAFIAPNWNLEADGTFTPATAKAVGDGYQGIGVPGGDVKASTINARLVYNFPLGNLPSFHIGAGGVLENFRGDENQGGATYQFGVNGLAGFNLGFSGVALRVDGLVNYLPSNGGKFDFGAQAGLQLAPDLRNLFGGGTMSTTPVMWAPYVWWDNMDAPLPGTVELGGFVQWTFFDDNAGLEGRAVAEDGLGYGGRVGVFLSDPRWELEGDGYYSPQSNEFAAQAGAPSDVNAHAFAARLNYNFPIGNFIGGRQSQFIIGAGPVRTSYKFKGGTNPPEDSYSYNYGGSALAGIRLGIANRTALRIDGVLDYMPNHDPDANMNIHVRGGLSFLVGGARPEVMCTYAGLESIPASSPNCVAPPPPPPPPPAVTPCPYNASIPSTDPNCVPAVDTTAITGPIYFDFDKSTIRPDAAATLDKKIPWLQANPGMRIRIEGNADERGSDEYNLALGQRRAASAKRYLVDHGIAADRFDLVSYGEERPVCTEHNETCWQQNRRDDFRIVTIGSDRIVVPPME
ncbi:MAG TPA: peptidoglycan-associated lipoprotein Pal [Gemmatimonadaceae bacterium]|nr:peptidoglycan-associated lipoprotein Pal [Gemmatimonadaceae bacterium]